MPGLLASSSVSDLINLAVLALDLTYLPIAIDGRYVWTTNLTFGIVTFERSRFLWMQTPCYASNAFRLLNMVCQCHGTLSCLNRDDAVISHRHAMLEVEDRLLTRIAHGFARKGKPSNSRESRTKSLSGG